MTDFCIKLDNEFSYAVAKHPKNVMCSGREITAGHRKMSGQNELLSGQISAWSVILTVHF